MGARPVLVGFALLAAVLVKNAINVSSGAIAAQNVARQNTTLTAVPGIKVGHHTLTERPTGCTVVLAEAGITAGVDVRGSANSPSGGPVPTPVVPGALRNLWQPLGPTTLAGLLDVAPKTK